MLTVKQCGSCCRVVSRRNATNDLTWSTSTSTTGTTGTSIDMGSVVTIFLSSAVLAGVFLIGFVRVFTNREYS